VTRSVEKIFSPLVVASSHQPHDMPAGMQVEGARFAHQLHAGFERELVALAAVAGMATSYKVFPSR
jgi:hypothetical protein